MRKVLERLLNSGTLRTLEQALDGATLRQQVIANNIANVNTPHFKRSDVQFEAALAAELRGDAKLTPAVTHPRHLRATRDGVPAVVTDRASRMRSDGNNVDIDTEMANLVKNNLYFEAVARQASAVFERLRTAISEGRR